MVIKYLAKVVTGCMVSVLLLAPTTWSETSPGRMESVSVSPDGKTIAVDFTKGKKSHIFFVALATGNATRLINDNKGEESDLSFSPDGKHIAYTYLPPNGERSRIIVGNADGSDLHAWLPSTENVRDFSPTFSPDNETLIFARSRFYGNHSPIAQPHNHVWDFYSAHLDGTNIRQLTNQSFYNASRISVSPDGKSMVVMTEDLDTPQQIAIYSLEQTDKPARVLRPRVPGHERIYSCPNFMPDGKSILFLAATEGWQSYDYDVYRLDLETGAVDRLTKKNGYATDLRVFTNGKTAAFLKWRSDRHATPVESFLYLLDLQSRNVAPIKVNGLD
jgi:dipeptidyl aminopeptidase/acylaminoacyl peptidase